MTNTKLKTEPVLSLAALAPRTYKPKKAEAQIILKELADKYPEAGRELAQLYTYFMPPKPKRPKTAFEWCASAINPDDLRREYLHFVRVEADRMIGADGNRMHVTPNNQQLPPGYYNHVGDLVHELDYYPAVPDFGKVLENHAPVTDAEKYSPTMLEACAIEKEAELCVQFYDALYRLRYVREACALADKDDDLIVHACRRDALRIDYPNGKGRALIMPVHFGGKSA